MTFQQGWKQNQQDDQVRVKCNFCRESFIFGEIACEQDKSGFLIYRCENCKKEEADYAEARKYPVGSDYTPEVWKKSGTELFFESLEKPFKKFCRQTDLMFRQPVGSDYTPEQLSKSVEELSVKTECGQCEGTGQVAVACDNYGAVDLDICPVCFGEKGFYSLEGIL